MQIFKAEVIRTARLTPGMMRVTLGGNELASFASTGVGDEFVRLFFPAEGQVEPNLPRATGSGWRWDDGVEPAPLRTYTVRSARPDENEIVIDFVLHSGGLASEWAMRARPGSIVGLNSPTGLYDAPEELEWQILIADAAGLPAASRLLEQTPAGIRTRAIFEVAALAHEQSLRTTSQTDITWLLAGNGKSPSRIDEIIRSIELPAGMGYVWVAGETKDLRSVRKYLRHEVGLPASAYKVVAYWTYKGEEWLARYEGLDDTTKESLAELWEDTDRDEEAIEDEYIARLESLGL